MIRLSTHVATHAGLLLDDEVFDYDDKGWKRRYKNDVLSEFDFNAKGYPSGSTNEGPDELQNKIIEDGNWSEGTYLFFTHNCHHFVTFCLNCIGHSIIQSWFIIQPAVRDSFTFIKILGIPFLKPKNPKIPELFFYLN